MNSLLVKAWLGLIALLVILGVMLFVAAGTLYYWQTWLYLVVFAECVIGVMPYLIQNDRRLLANRVTAELVAEVQKSQQVIQSLASLFFMRHPMYAGALFLLLFTPLALGSWVAIPFVLPLTLVITARLLDEQKYLESNLSGYSECCGTVYYRLMPFVW